MRTTTVRITPDIERIINKFGRLLVLQEAFEVGCDLIERMLIRMEKEDNKHKLLKEQEFYESVSKVN